MNSRDLVIDVRDILAKAKLPVTNDCCIYRVPHEIREVNENAYTPEAVSIGPLHHNDQNLQNMEKYKQVYFKQFVARGRISLEDLINSVEEEEPRLRRSYSENLKMSADKLIKVILADACFVVELFWKKWTNDDTVLNRRRESYKKHIYSASAYNEAGVKFETNGSKCILDLQFFGSCLKIPHIQVVDETEILFRNMLALEQCHYPHEGYITDYAFVMDYIINTGKDVDVLVKNKIFLNWLGDNDDVAKMFNSICKNIVVSNFNCQYTGVFDELDVFYNTTWHKMRATLKRDYCNTPWRTVATVAAIVILLFTFIQTVCSIIQAV